MPSHAAWHPSTPSAPSTPSHFNPPGRSDTGNLIKRKAGPGELVTQTSLSPTPWCGPWPGRVSGHRQGGWAEPQELWGSGMCMFHGSLVLSARKQEHSEDLGSLLLRHPLPPGWQPLDCCACGFPLGSFSPRGLVSRGKVFLNRLKTAFPSILQARSQWTSLYWALFPSCAPRSRSWLSSGGAHCQGFFPSPTREGTSGP